MLQGISSEHHNNQEPSEDVLLHDNIDADEHEEKESKVAVQTECLSVFFNERPAI